MKTLDAAGNAVAGDDPNRTVWYGLCTYWTDDWDTLRKSDSIPCCPSCGCPGFQTSAQRWFDGAAGFQREGNPGYVNFLNATKETCRGKSDFLAWYRQWLKENPTGSELPNPRSDGS